MSRARFRIERAKLDVSHPVDGFVTIDRNAGTFTVRRLHTMREYTLPLAVVASIVVAKVIKADVAAARAPRKGKP